MENDPDRVPQTVLDDLRSLAAEEAARTIVSVIHDGATPEQTATIVELLADRHFGDPILTCLELDALESLAELCVTRLDGPRRRT